MACSHCWESGHTKPKCPDRHLSSEEVQAKSAARTKAYYATVSAVAELLADYPAEQRATIVREAFGRAGTKRHIQAWDLVRQVEHAEAQRLKATLAPSRKLDDPDRAIPPSTSWNGRRGAA